MPWTGTVMFSCGSQGQLGNLGQMLKYKVRGVSAQLPTRPRCRNPSSGVTTNSTWRRRPTPAPWKSFHLTFPTFRLYIPQLWERNKQANACKGCVLCILERESAGSQSKVAFLRLPALPDGHQELCARVTDVRAGFTQLHTCNARLGATRNRSTRNNCLASNHFLPPVFASLPFIPPLLSFTFTLSYIQLCINFKFKFALKVNVWHDNFLSSTFWSNACSIQRFVKTVQSSCFIFEDTQEARVSRVTKYEHCK